MYYLISKIVEIIKIIIKQKNFNFLALVDGSAKSI